MNVLNTISDHLDILYRPADLLVHLQALPVIAAVVLVSVGAACIYNGYRWHKWIVVILALMLGFGLGHMLSQEVGKSTVIALALGIFFAAIAIPKLRYTVAFFSGVAGAAIGATLWTFLYRDQPDLAWAGAGMGFIALALLSFLFFRIVVILFTSVSGGVMLVTGGIAALLHVSSAQGVVSEQLLMHPAILPLLILMAATIGIVIQQGQSGNDENAEAAEEE